MRRQYFLGIFNVFCFFEFEASRFLKINSICQNLVLIWLWICNKHTRRSSFILGNCWLVFRSQDFPPHIRFIYMTKEPHFLLYSLFWFWSCSCSFPFFCLQVESVIFIFIYIFARLMNYVSEILQCLVFLMMEFHCGIFIFISICTRLLSSDSEILQRLRFFNAGIILWHLHFHLCICKTFELCFWNTTAPLSFNDGLTLWNPLVGFGGDVGELCGEN